ncbi:type VI secretion system Vgr family protein [Azohydromonas australica]|uniref:type VI secretion system Vgr family protein n=1 Tax=Azohydromonas australica TaxID=364039 RepID=UPI000416E373|nr:type VI secretion system Vgr family protein [Azohydromonas australica]
MSGLPSLALDVLRLMDEEPRLYHLQGDGALSRLRVEAWVAEEALSEPFRLELCCLSEDPRLDLDALCAQPVALLTRLDDGRIQRRSGLVDLAVAEDCDGSLARYRLVVRPWAWFLGLSRRSQVWQDQRVVDIVNSLLGRYRAWARWRWAPCVEAHLERAHQRGVRPCTVQYRESDLDFLQRLLAEEGIAWRFEEADTGQPGGVLVLFADSRRRSSCPEDAASQRAPLRLQHAHAQESGDTLQEINGHCRAAVSVLSTLSHHEDLGRGVGARVQAERPRGGAHAPALESYDGPGTQAWATAEQAQRALWLAQQAIDAHCAGWHGQGVVRSFQAGTVVRLADPLEDLDSGEPVEGAELLLTRVLHVGLNNLPARLSRALVQHLGDEPVLPLDCIPAGLLERAAQRGYANSFDAIAADLPWRPLPSGMAGSRTPRKPQPGLLLATVVGPDGSTQPRGADEVHTDRLGRVRIRYEFQGDADNAEGTSLASCWVRVQQPLAGSGGRGAMGAQWTPRIGHEVLVQGMDGDIDRPVVVCSLYDGRGEGGELPTPGGKAWTGPRQPLDVFTLSSDARTAGQGNPGGGHSPAWHGASPALVRHGGQNNAAALSGHKSKELGGSGFSQLVHDDTPSQERLQLATTQHASQLNLGHLIHQADNHRGSFRGLGFELRTDAYGAIRAARGLLLSTYAADWAAPAQDNAVGLALARQFEALARALHQAAQTHQTVGLSGLLGSVKAGASVADGQRAPIPAWLAQAGAQGSGRRFEQAVSEAQSGSQADGAVPLSGAPVLSAAACAGLGLVAGQDFAVAASENVHLACGGDMDAAVGGAARIHAGQAIGILGGAIQPGQDAAGTGVSLIAGAGDLELQAQDGPLQVAAAKDVTVQSAHGSIDWAAVKRIVISTAGGAAVVLENGNVEFIAPGTLTVRAGRRSFVGPANFNYQMPLMPCGTLTFSNERRISI